MKCGLQNVSSVEHGKQERGFAIITKNGFQKKNVRVVSFEGWLCK